MGKQKNEQTPAPISKGALVGGIIGSQLSPLGGGIVGAVIGKHIEENGGIQKTAESILELRGKKKQQDVQIRGQKQQQDRNTYTSQESKAAFGISADEVRIDGNGISLHNVKIGGKFGKKKNYKD